MVTSYNLFKNIKLKVISRYIGRCKTEKNVENKVENNEDDYDTLLDDDDGRITARESPAVSSHDALVGVTDHQQIDFSILRM